MKLANRVDLRGCELAVGSVTRDAVQVLHLMLLQYSSALYCRREANVSAWDIERRALHYFFLLYS
jgi:hypothetical protein